MCPAVPFISFNPYQIITPNFKRGAEKQVFCYLLYILPKLLENGDVEFCTFSNIITKLFSMRRNLEIKERMANPLRSKIDTSYGHKITVVFVSILGAREPLLLLLPHLEVLPNLFLICVGRRE